MDMTDEQMQAVEADQERRQRLGRAPVGVEERQVPDDETGGVHSARFQVLGGGAGVADVWIGEGDDLPAIRRVGEYLLIPRHRCIENYFPCRVAFCAYRDASEHGAIFES